MTRRCWRRHPADFAKTLASRQAAKVQLALDGTDSNTASIAAATRRPLVGAYSIELRNRS